MWIREYLKEKWKMLLFEVSFLLFLNFYFVVLCSTRVRLEDLTYLDLLLIFTAVVWGGLDYHAWSRKKRRRRSGSAKGKDRKR